MTSHPLIVVVLDAADARLLLEWQGAGALPAIASILQQGQWGLIGGDDYLTPHGLWLSLYSGVSKSEHGFYYYRQLQPSTYVVAPHDLRSVSAAPFWAAADAAGARIAILDVPESHTVPGLGGCQLANFRIHNAPGEPEALPPSLLRSVIAAGGPRQVLQERANSTIGQDRSFCRQLVQRVQGTGRFCVEILERERPDCTVIGFSETHIAGHQLWKYRDSATDMADAIRIVYQEIDRQLALIMRASPPGANFLLVSNTGIQDQTPTAGLLRSFCETLGYQVRRPGRRNSASLIGRARRLIPQSLQAYAMYRVSARLRHRMLTRLYPIDSDWSRTTAFVLPTSYTGMIRVNLKDREPAGIVEPGAEYESVLDRLETDLLCLIDPATGEPAVASVHRTARMYRSGPPEVLPDLVVKWKPSRHFQETLHHPRATIRQHKPLYYRQNNHTDYGFFAACGPSVEARGSMPEASLANFAPLLRSWLGIAATRQVPSA